MILRTGFSLSRPTKCKYEMVKYTRNDDPDRKFSRKFFVCSGKSSMYAMACHDGEQSEIKRAQMAQYRILEFCGICARKSKHGGGVVGDVWWLEFLGTYKPHTQCNFISMVIVSYGEIKTVREAMIFLHLVSYIFTKALLDFPCCMSPSSNRLGGNPFLHYQEISSANEGDRLAVFMTCNDNLLVFDDSLILAGQLLKFWHMCITLRNSEQGRGERRRERWLYFPICVMQPNAIKAEDIQEVNAITSWQTRKETCVVNKYHSHFLQGTSPDRIHYTPYFGATHLKEIKNNSKGFDISLILSQLLFLICINSEMIMEIAIMTQTQFQQIEYLPTPLNSDLNQRLNHYLMPVLYKLFFILLILISKPVTTVMSSNTSQNDFNVHSQPEQGQINPDLLDCCLVGRWLSNKPIRFHATRNRLSHLWQPEKKMDVALTENNRFLFQFFDQADMERVLQTGPWHFDSYPMLLRKLQFGENPLTMPIDTMDIWIQVHNLPFGFMNEPMGSLLGNHVGKLLKYDFNNNFGPWRKYMRLRVAMEVTIPLKQCWEFERDGADPVTVFFKYENIGNFCYICGLLGHTDGFCPKRFEKGFIEGTRKWGPSLKAEVQGVQGGVATNPWLRNQGIGTGGPEAGKRLNCNKFHSRVGRVKIGRNPVTKGLIFAKYIGAQNSSTEWICFDPFSADFNVWPVAETAAANSGPTPLQLTEAGATSDARVEEEGDAARIDRLIQEARLKNPVQVLEIPNAATNTNRNVLMQNLVLPRMNDVLPLKISTKEDGSKQLKRSRIDDDEVSAGIEVSDVDAVQSTIGSLAIDSEEIVMRDNCLFESDNVMAGPGHQACQEK